MENDDDENGGKTERDLQSDEVTMVFDRSIFSWFAFNLSHNDFAAEKKSVAAGIFLKRPFNLTLVQFKW